MVGSQEGGLDLKRGVGLYLMYTFLISRLEQIRGMALLRYSEIKVGQVLK